MGQKKFITQSKNYYKSLCQHDESRYDICEGCNDSRGKLNSLIDIKNASENFIPTEINMQWNGHKWNEIQHFEDNAIIITARHNSEQLVDLPWQLSQDIIKENNKLITEILMTL